MKRKKEIRHKKKKLMALLCLVSIGQFDAPQQVYASSDLGKAWNDSIRINRKYYPSRSMRVYRGTIGPSMDRGKRKIKWLRSSVGVDVSENSCGGIDFGAMFKLNFNKNAASEFVEDLKGTLMGLVGAAPMLLLEIIDPNLASFFKNLQTNSFLNMDTNMASCEKVYESVKGVGQKLFNSERKSCIKKMTEDGSSSYEDALKGCGEGFQMIGKFLDNPAGPVTRIASSINEKLQKSMGDGYDPEYVDLIESLVGVTEVSGRDGVILTSKLKRRSLNDMKKGIISKLEDDFEIALEAKANGSTPPQSAMDDISTDLSPMNEGVLEDILDLDDMSRQRALNNLYQVIANRRLVFKLEELKKHLSNMANRSDVKEMENAGIINLKRTIEKLEDEEKKLNTDVEQANIFEKVVSGHRESVNMRFDEFVERGESMSEDVSRVTNGTMGRLGGLKYRDSSERF